jgi:hypothetical protein
MAAAFATALPGASLAASPSNCQVYASNAIYYFRVMTTHADSCRHVTDARWQPVYQNHYNWCLRAPDAWLISEGDARVSYLKRCGALINFDDSQ